MKSTPQNLVVLFGIGVILFLSGAALIYSEYSGRANHQKTSSPGQSLPESASDPLVESAGQIKREDNVNPDTPVALQNAVRTIVLILLYSPHDRENHPISGLVSFYAATEDGPHADPFATLEMQGDGTVRIDTHVQGQIHVRITGVEFVELLFTLEPLASTVEEHTIYLTPHPAMVRVRLKSEEILHGIRIGIQESSFISPIPLLTGQWRDISSVHPGSEVEIEFAVYPYATYFTAAVLSTGFLITAPAIVEKLAPGVESTVDLSIADGTDIAVSVQVEVRAVEMPNAVTALFEVGAAASPILGAIQRLALRDGRGAATLDIPTGADFLLRYADGYSAPLLATLRRNSGGKLEIIEVLGGQLSIQDNALLIFPAPSHSLVLPESMGKLVLNPKDVSQSLDSSRRRFPVQCMGLSDGQYRLQGIGEATRGVRILGSEYSLEELRSISDGFVPREEVLVTIGAYLSERVSGVLLQARVLPRGSSYYLEAYSMLKNGEDVFVLEGKLPRGNLHWSLRSLTDGRLLKEGEFTISMESQRIALR